MMTQSTATLRILDGALLRRALLQALIKLDPRRQIRNPVMFVVEVCAAFATWLWFESLRGAGQGEPGFLLQLALWLWFTLIFANFAEAMAEGRGKAQADALRTSRREVEARRLITARDRTSFERVAGSDLRKGDTVLVEAGETIPADGEIIDGIATIDESAITGESAPVVRESGGDRSAVTGGTRVLSDAIVVKVTSDPGATFLDRMIAMVEGAKRMKTPMELALDILLAALSLVFLLVTATLLPFSIYAVEAAGVGTPVPIAVLLALLVCLIPTTIGGLLSAIGIAGMDRMMRNKVIAMSGRAVEASGDVDVLFLDKTGTITLGNRRADAFLAAPGVHIERLAEAAMLASLADDTPEGKSIVALAQERHNLDISKARAGAFESIAFSAETRMSGADLPGRSLRKGAADAVSRYVAKLGGHAPAFVRDAADRVARSGGTPLVVAEGAEVLGVVHLKDILKAGIRERFAELRRMGIKTVMITGDNPLTAAAIAAEAGVDEFLAEATPENKLELIRRYQAEGHMVAMTGDGTNDAPALAQSNVAVAMNSGTQAAKEAANLVDLDSDPTKLLEIVSTGKQLLMTRGALTTFSLANDIAKYFAIIPAAFATVYPALGLLNVMALGSPASAVLSAVVFNALSIVLLIPLALRGVRYTPAPAAVLLRRNVLIYGVGGLFVPFVGIKLVDLLINALHLV